MNLIYVLDEAFNICESAKPILGLVGYVILGIKIVVPIILIIMGMMDLAKAVTEKKEEDIKKGQMLLVKKAIAAVMVFLVATIVTIVMQLVKGTQWTECTHCLVYPQDACCAIDATKDTGCTLGSYKTKTK